MEINEWCKNCAKLKNCGMRIPCGHFEPKKPKTNFQRITASPEALAEFINKAEETYERCCKGDIRCDFCDCQWRGIAGRSELVEWLKKESKE